MRFFSCLVVAVFLAVFECNANASFNPCSVSADEAVTSPAKVEMSNFMPVFLALNSHTPYAPLVLKDIPDLSKKFSDLFESSHPTSKLHQFFHALYLLGEHTEFPPGKPSVLRLETAAVRHALTAGRVFPNEDFSKNISYVEIQPVHSNQFKQYWVHVGYTQNPTSLPLNNGNGFGVFRDGKCQHAKSLIFYGNFSFRTRLLENENLLVYDFENVDLSGDFGARSWLVTVDLNLVSLREVEFIKGTNKGRVKAYVSRREFQKNKHHWLLEMVTRVIPDNSVQVIDW